MLFILAAQIDKQLSPLAVCPLSLILHPVFSTALAYTNHSNSELPCIHCMYLDIYPLHVISAARCIRERNAYSINTSVDQPRAQLLLTLWTQRFKEIDTLIEGFLQQNADLLRLCY